MMWRWFRWVLLGLLIVIVLIAGGFVARKFIKNDNGNSNSNSKTKFTTFPVKLEDFVVPPKMYGLWPYGVKGKNSSDHNEGHPGWDFELKKGSKIYAIGDLTIDQIHDGDKTSGDLTPQVIEAISMLGSQRFHITYHSVVNISSNVKEGVKIKEGEVLAEVGYPLSDDSAMIHFGIFPPHDSVGACPGKYFSDDLQVLIDKIVANSINTATNKAFESACVGKINKELYLQNYPNQEKYLGGSEQWE